MAFVSGSTAFGIFDSDVGFATDADLPAGFAMVLQLGRAGQ